MPETNFFWDPLSDNILQERDENGAVTADYTAETGLYGNVISQNRGGAASQFHYDALGSTLALSDDNQQVTDIRAYTAFGETTEQTGNTEFPFHYAGQKGYYWNRVLGSHFVRRRQYDPARSEWLSYDPIEQSVNVYYAPILNMLLERIPIGYTIGMSLYIYSLNNPVRYLDPMGTLTVEADPESTTGECGDTVSTVFSLKTEGPNKVILWLVQKVTFRCKVAECDDCPLGEKPLPDVHVNFWEAIRLPITPGTHTIKDKSGGVCTKDSCGIKDKAGEAKVFAERITGDLSKDMKWSKEGKELGEGDCIVNPIAADARIESFWTAEEPKWWAGGGAVGRTAKRSTTIKWTCCDCMAPECSLKTVAEPKK